MAAADSYFMNRLPKKLTDLDLGASGLVDRLRRASTTTKVAVCVSVAGGVLLLRRKRKGKPPAPQPTSYYCHEPPVKSFVTGADSALVRGMSSSGPGARDPETVPELLKRLETNTTKAVAWEENGAWRDLTWADYVSLVRQAARAMIAIGLEPRKGVGIIGFNSLEWVVADLGCVLAGGLAAGIYATNGADAARYVLDHSSAQLCFCDGAAQLEKIRKAAETLPKLKKIIVWGGALRRNQPVSCGGVDGVEVLKFGFPHRWGGRGLGREKIRRVDVEGFPEQCTRGSGAAARARRRRGAGPRVHADLYLWYYWYSESRHDQPR